MLSSRPGTFKQLHGILSLGHPISRSMQQCLHPPHRLCARHLAAKASRSKSVPSQPDEDDEAALPPRSVVHLDKKDFTIEQLARKVRKGDLDLQPAYQRGLVWDKKMASRLVVTALEERVLPAVFLEEAEDGTYSVMDGKQRLASLIAFFTGSADIGGLQWDAAPTTLHITDDTTCDPRTFAGLPKARQRQFENYSVMCIIVKSDTDRDVVFAIYQDINTGSVGHTDQQSRKAAFHGPYVELLDELATNEHFLKIRLPNQREAKPDSEKESDRELALRFFAMCRSADTFRTPMIKFLNREIKEHQNAEEAELQRLRNMFKESVATVWQIWGPGACRDDTAKDKDKLSPSLWDAAMVAVWREVQEKGRKRDLTDNADKIRAAYKELLLDGDFRKSLSSISKANVKRRIDMMAEMLRKAAPKSWRDPQRAFQRDVRQQLWDKAVAAGGAAGVICSICGQVIHTVSDADVDHIKAYSTGGSTTPDNAQLAHMSCNRSKGSREARPQ